VDLETIYIQQIIDGDINRFSWFVEKYQEMAFATAWASWTTAMMRRIVQVLFYGHSLFEIF